MRSSTFMIPPEMEKLIAQIVANQMLKNSGKVRTGMESHFDRGWLIAEGDCLQPEFLELDTADICSIIEGRVLALLKPIYRCHEFVVIAHFHAFPQLGSVQLEIHMDAII